MPFSLHQLGDILGRTQDGWPRTLLAGGGPSPVILGLSCAGYVLAKWQERPKFWINMYKTQNLTKTFMCLNRLLSQPVLDIGVFEHNDSKDKVVLNFLICLSFSP